MASLTCTVPSCALRSTFLGEDSGLRASTQRPTKVSVPYRRLVIECKGAKIGKESRIGKKPVEVPSNVEVLLEGQFIKTKGPLGELSLTYPDEVKAERELSGLLRISKAVDNRRAHQMHGLFR
ncbi:hypothetical protein KI387_041914, partial [Taxus chinensis]